MSEVDAGPRDPTARQVLYGLVAGAFHVVVGVLGWASAGLAPTWWNWALAGVWMVLAGFLVMSWRRTGPALVLTIGEFVAWTIGAAILLT